MAKSSQDQTAEITGQADRASDAELLRLTAALVAAYTSNNTLPVGELPLVIELVRNSLADLNSKAGREHRKPAVPIEESVRSNFLVCLEDGRKFKMLKRHLRSTYGMTPAEYRSKWGLPSDYPMVAPNYAKERADFARKMGLGSVVRKGHPSEKPNGHG